MGRAVPNIAAHPTTASVPITVLLNVLYNIIRTRSKNIIICDSAVLMCPGITPAILNSCKTILVEILI